MLSAPLVARSRNKSRTSGHLFRESAFFKTYQVRDPTGGFREEPELPPIAVDEAVVNAVAHRDYAVSLPIECEKYTDALVVRSPGPVLQQRYVPEHFSLDDTRLDHIPRNPRLMGWLQSIKDAKGNPFVFALREGTTRMLAEMRALGLPAPSYSVGPVITEVVLHSDATRREAEFSKAASTGHVAKTTEQANLFLLGCPSVSSYAGQPPTRGNAYPRWPAQSIGLVYQFATIR